MEDVQRRVLVNMTKKIVHDLTDPVGMAGTSLAKFLPASDKDSVEREADRHGIYRANQVLVKLLEKRGPRVFKAFVNALRSSDHQMTDLADAIEAEEAMQSGQQPAQALSLICTVENESVSGICAEPDLVVARGIPTSQQSTTHRPQENQRQPQTDCKKEVTSTKQPEALGINTYLKNIPGSIHQTITQCLSVEDPLGKDWRAIAGCMNLSITEIRTLNQDKNKMEGLFAKMTHNNMRVKDLVGFLANENVGRWDIIDELKTAGLVSDSDLSSLPGASLLKMVTLSSPQQEQEFNQLKCGTDDTARLPVEQDSSDKGKYGDKLPSLDLSYAQDGHDAGATGYPVPQDNQDDGENVSERLEDLELSDDDDDSHQAKENVPPKMALLIGCLKYDNLDSLGDDFRHIIKSDLHHALDDADWVPVTRKIRKEECSSMVLRREIQRFVDESKDTICLVYLAGHTVQVNGETYLLPTDIKTDMNQADLVEASVNVNKLIASLSKRSRLSLVFVDGAHQCSQNFQCRGVLEGFTAVTPLPNVLVAFPCRPGTIRPPEERLHYIKSLVQQLQHKGLSMEELFLKIRRELLKLGVSSPPVEYSLTRSGLPFYLKPPGEEDSVGLQVPDGSTSQYTIIFANSRCGSQVFQNLHTDHLFEALRGADRMQVEKHEDLTSEETKTLLRNRLMELAVSDPRLKVVMVYFIGAAFQDERGENFLAGVDGSLGSQASSRHVPLQWIVDLMCELVNGPKLLVVDDVQTNCEQGLAPMTAPQECLLSLPCARDNNWSPEYTLRLAQLIGVNQSRSISKILRRASAKEHHIYSNLFFA